MHLSSDGMDDIITEVSTLDMEGNYKKVRGKEKGGGGLFCVGTITPIFVEGKQMKRLQLPPPSPAFMLLCCSKEWKRKREMLVHESGSFFSI